MLGYGPLSSKDLLKWCKAPIRFCCHEEYGHCLGLCFAYLLPCCWLFDISLSGWAITMR